MLSPKVFPLLALLWLLFSSACCAKTDYPWSLWELRESIHQKRFEDAVKQALSLRAEAEKEQRYQVVAEVDLHLYDACLRLHRTEEGEEAYSHFLMSLAQAQPDTERLGMQMRDLRRNLGLPTDGIYPEERLLKMQPSSGFVRSKLDQLLANSRDTGADGILVLHRGERLLEWYSPYYQEPMYTMSSVKSITSLLAGILVDRGKLAVQDPVAKYLPSWSRGRRGQVTVEHLLTMSSGLSRRQGGLGTAHPEGINLFVESLEPEVEPGSKWAYSNEGAQLLSPVLEAACGESLDVFAERNLFQPMGLKQTRLRRVGQDVVTYADALTTLPEFARFGQLLLDGGTVGGKQIVSHSWLNAAVQPSPRSRDYGYLFWLSDKPLRAWMMQGYLGTSVIVCPDLQLVVARVQRRPYLHSRTEFSESDVLQILAESDQVE